MVVTSSDQFERIVAEAMDRIPARFLRQLENVAVVIADEPTPAQMCKMRLRDGRALFGLYEGIPKTIRGSWYTAVAPDKITIFKSSLEAAAEDMESLKAIVYDTVWHEIGHHFGMDEVRVRKAERSRRMRKNKR